MTCSVLNYVLFSILLTICLVHTQVSAKPGRPRRDRFKVQVQNYCVEHPMRGSCGHEAGVIELQPDEATEWDFRLPVDVHFNISCQVLLLGTTKTADVLFFSSQRDPLDTSLCFADGHTGSCYWKVDENAVYYSNDDSTWIKEYNWSMITYGNTKENVIGALY